MTMYDEVSRLAPDTLDYAALDPGIRDVVRQLRAAGFDTTDSGDGVSKPRAWFESGEAMPFPHVAATVAWQPDDTARSAGLRLIDEADRMTHLLGAGWRVDATYFPSTRTMLLLATADEGPR